MFEETPARSVVKALSWRLVATLTTITLVFVATSRFDLALTVGVFEAMAKMALYFMHERLWNRLLFGRKRVHHVLVPSEKLAS